MSQGTSGIWRYRTYSSGVKECWGYVNASVSSQVVWGSGYLGYTAYRAFPFTFSRTPTANVTVGGGSGVWASIGNYSTSQMEFYFLSFQSMSGMSLPVYIHAIG